MDFGPTPQAEGFDREPQTEGSDDTSASTLTKLLQKREVLREEVASLRRESKEVMEFLRTRTTCSSRNAEIEDKIKFVCGDIDLLGAKKSDLETEIAALEMRTENARSHPTLEEGLADDVEEQNERAISFYEKILQFRLDNEIFDDDFPSLQAMKNSLSECTEFMKQMKVLRKQLSKPSIEDLNSTAGKNAYKDALRSYIELSLRYHEVQLSRVKLVASRLRRAMK